MIIKELKSSKYLNQKVVCVIDDNPSKKENTFMESALSEEEIRFRKQQRSMMQKKLSLQFLRQEQKYQRYLKNL